MLGAVRAPLATNDFSSFPLQAQSSRAKTVGLANAGTDFDLMKILRTIPGDEAFRPVAQSTCKLVKKG